MNDSALPDERRRLRYAYALALSAAAVVAYVYVRGVELPNLAEREALHSRVVDNEALAPYNYRVLVPFLVEGVAQTADALGAPPKHARVGAYALIDFVALSLFFIATYRFLTRIHPPGRSLVGLMTIAAFLPLSLRDHYYQPWSLVEMAIFAEALVAAYDRNLKSMLALTLVGSLNRATGVFVPAIYFLGVGEWSDARLPIAWRKIRRVAPAVSAGLGSLGVALALRWARGGKPSVHEPGDLLAINLQAPFLAQAAVHLALFGGALWYAAWRSRKRAHPFLKRMAWLVPLYGAPVLVFGVWMETRLLAPLYPILVGFALYALKDAFPESERSHNARS